MRSKDLKALSREVGRYLSQIGTATTGIISNLAVSHNVSQATERSFTSYSHQTNESLSCIEDRLPVRSPLATFQQLLCLAAVNINSPLSIDLLIVRAVTLPSLSFWDTC